MVIISSLEQKKYYVNDISKVIIYIRMYDWSQILSEDRSSSLQFIFQIHIVPFCLRNANIVEHKNVDLNILFIDRNVQLNTQKSKER